MSEILDKGANFSYQALSQLSRLFYEKFGDDALPIISDVWYKMGLASGKLLKKKLATTDFKSAANLFAENAKKSEAMEACKISNRLFLITTKSGFNCDVSLEDAGCLICEAVMNVNRGQFMSICGLDVKMNIVKSRAKGDDCCEIIYRPIDVQD